MNIHHIGSPVPEQLPAGSQLLLESIKKRFGRIPNLHAAIGYSPVALNAFLDFDELLSRGVFTAVEREAIALAVSEVNRCDYCLAAHTFSSIARGISLEHTLAFRRGMVDDPKVQAIVQLAKSMTENKGMRDDQLLTNFFNAGFDEAALVELIGLVTVRIFTNYVFSTFSVPVDFPGAPSIAKPAG